MPRILPRLVKLPLSGNFPFPEPKNTRTPHRPPRPLHSVLPQDYPRSVLLSEGNVITNSHDYAHHKSPAPLPRRRVTLKTPKTEEPRREMSAQEYKWWSSPYLRMLATPLRQCYLTQRLLPTDFLIRIAKMRVPVHLQQKRKGTADFFFPDGLQHPKFKKPKATRGMYIMCRREALHILHRPGKYKRIGATAPPRFAEYIAHLLRLRVLQELQILLKPLEFTYRTRTGPVPARPPILRRLTRAEWGALRTTGVLPHPGALAVLVVPPVNRDPTTLERPTKAGAMGARPLTDPTPERVPARPTPPLSVLHPVDSTAEEEGEEVRVQPHAEERVPLYNGVVLFPGRIQRAKLHALLTKILSLEGASRFSAGAAGAHGENANGETGNERLTVRKGDNKGSHAFLVYASTEVDMVPLAIALWRVRMWEGGGWRTDNDEKEEWPWVQEVRIRSRS
ncbi:hypothetical protein B0H16DRAFT_1299588 [Mycena metata]|uniref:Uncharacterized protein n=1 Tax=Mycena metata TaxID=1033252 RepID=A0AAD7NZE9_9AGAR|nr:hypothetical protein B0H16DRAFT_1299588 [Mycena metata]